MILGSGQELLGPYLSGYRREGPEKFWAPSNPECNQDTTNSRSLASVSTIEQPFFSKSDCKSPRRNIDEFTTAAHRRLRIFSCVNIVHPSQIMLLQGQALVHGEAYGEILFSHVGLSFWGGVDTATGEIIDRHHPLSGIRLRGHVLAIPCGRGSCSGSIALLEILLNSTGPAALVFQLREQILTLGVIVAKMLFDTHIPVVLLNRQDFSQLQNQTCSHPRRAALHFRHMFKASL
ncbi:Aconitase/3-isopropylmalate dehydratase [Exophiala viscosa]|uniref:Aconitase/3-isopropylmalate dehydratase n=1 Tax=Exophiala viscosa TaxID=2486360 RepID=UPI00219E9C64|nr:Aconitase/3-isopropylmalate dehydratase [Exophiala viscosa]